MADLSLRQIRDSDAIQCRHRHVAVLSSHATTPTDLAVESHCDHVEHTDRKVPIDAFSLWYIATAVPVLAVGLAEYHHTARSSRYKVKHRLDQGALAGAVWANHAHKLASRQIEAHVPKHGLALVGDRQVIDREG